MSGPCHQRAPPASKVPLCETEKCTPPPRNATPTIKSKAWSGISAPTCSLYWTSLVTAQPAQTATTLAPSFLPGYFTEEASEFSLQKVINLPAQMREGLISTAFYIFQPGGISIQKIHPTTTY